MLATYSLFSRFAIRIGCDRTHLNYHIKWVFYMALQRTQSIRDLIAKNLSMEPLEYCRLYVKNPQPGNRGYRAACVRVLVEATFGIYAYQTIDKNWGSQFERRPDDALKILKIAHTLNSIGQKLEVIHPAVEDLLEQVLEIAPYKQHK